MVLEDKVYEELDFVSRLVEPWDFEVLRVMDAISSRYELSAADIIALDKEWENYKRINIAIERHMDLSQWPQWATAIALRTIETTFEMETSGEEVVVDVVDMTLSGGKVFLNTMKPDVRKLPMRIALNLWQTHDERTHTKDHDIPRLKEVADILGVPSRDRSKKHRSMFLSVRNRFLEIIEKDEWRIRSDKVLAYAVRWIFIYSTTGNYSAYASLLNLKCLVHRGNPIYSAEEV
jgi:hypothetical protein